MENKNKTQKLPPEVYYLVLNGAKQYFKNKEDAEEMARKLYEDGTSPGGIYTENDPDEIQDLYDVGYFHDDDKPDYEVVNDKSIDAIKDNFTPPGAKGEDDFDDDELYDQMESMGDLPSDMQIQRDLKANSKSPMKHFKDWQKANRQEQKEIKSMLDTNDNGKIEKDEMADFQKSLDDYAAKNKKGREDIPATYKR